MKKCIFKYQLKENINPAESIKGTYVFNIPDTSKKTIGTYFKEHIDHLFSLDFLTEGYLDYALITCYNWTDVAKRLPETLVSQLDVMRDDWETTQELFLNDLGGLSDNTMCELLQSLSAEEFYDFLFNKYYFDMDMLTYDYCGKLEIEDDGQAE